MEDKLKYGDCLIGAPFWQYLEVLTIEKRASNPGKGSEYYAKICEGVGGVFYSPTSNKLFQIADRINDREIWNKLTFQEFKYKCENTFKVIR